MLSFAHTLYFLGFGNICSDTEQTIEKNNFFHTNKDKNLLAAYLTLTVKINWLYTHADMDNRVDEATRVVDLRLIRFVKGH